MVSVESSCSSCYQREVHEGSDKAELWDSLVKMLDKLNSQSTDTFKRVSITTTDNKTIIHVKF